MSVKILALIGTQPESFEYGNTFVREDVAGRGRLQIGLNNTQDGCVQLFAGLLVGPFQLLYLLHTSRTGAELGRYESPELTAEAVDEFIREFGRFLSQDSRHDLWLRSHDDDATIVLDRHNIICAYGPLDVFEAALLGIGVRPGPHSVRRICMQNAVIAMLLAGWVVSACQNSPSAFRRVERNSLSAFTCGDVLWKSEPDTSLARCVSSPAWSRDVYVLVLRRSPGPDAEYWRLDEDHFIPRVAGHELVLHEHQEFQGWYDVKRNQTGWWAETFSNEPIAQWSRVKVPPSASPPQAGIGGVFVFLDGQFRRVADTQPGKELLDIPDAAGTVFVGEPGLSVAARFDLEQIGRN